MMQSGLGAVWLPAVLFRAAPRGCDAVSSPSGRQAGWWWSRKWSCRKEREAVTGDVPPLLVSREREATLPRRARTIYVLHFDCCLQGWLGLLGRAGWFLQHFSAFLCATLHVERDRNKTCWRLTGGQWCFVSAAHLSHLSRGLHLSAVRIFCPSFD